VWQLLGKPILLRPQRSVDRSSVVAQVPEGSRERTEEALRTPTAAALPVTEKVRSRVQGTGYVVCTCKSGRCCSRPFILGRVLQSTVKPIRTVERKTVQISASESTISTQSSVV